MIAERFLLDRATGRLLRITLRNGRFVTADRWRDGRFHPADLAGFYAWVYREDVEEIPAAEAQRVMSHPHPHPSEKTIPSACGIDD
jgi:hypothetical protein